MKAKQELLMNVVELFMNLVGEVCGIQTWNRTEI